MEKIEVAILGLSLDVHHYLQKLQTTATIMSDLFLQLLSMISNLSKQPSFYPRVRQVCFILFFKGFL